MKQFLRIVCSEKVLICVLVLFAFALRLALALVNPLANDDHLQVSRLLLDIIHNHTVPELLELCWECYHPKFYHYLCAIVFSLLNIGNEITQVITANLINVGFGMCTCAVLILFIYEIEKTTWRRFLVIALVVLNPRLVATDIQATNDSAVIFWGVITTFFVWRGISLERPGYLCLSAVTIVLALLTKGSGMVLLTWMICVFIAWGVALPSWKRRVRALLPPIAVLVLLILGIFLLPEYFNPYPRYAKRLLEKGSFAAVNFDARPLPNFFERSYVGRPGVISIADSYFTFRLGGMLEDPVITNEVDIYPMHRTSLWSQLYGRYHFSFFDQWPWADTHPIVIQLGRLLLLCGIVPTILMIIGWVIQLQTLLKQKNAFLQGFLRSSDWICLLQSIAFVCFITLFTLEHRGFEAMKDIYVLPAILSFLCAFQRGFDFAYRFFVRNSFCRSMMTAALTVLVILYVSNSFLLYASISGLLQ